MLKDNLITDFLAFFNSNFKLNYPSSTGSGKSCFLFLIKFGGLEEMARNNSTFQRNILGEKTCVIVCGHFRISIDRQCNENDKMIHVVTFTTEERAVL